MPKLYPNLTGSYPCSTYNPTPKRAIYQAMKRQVISISLELGSRWSLPDDTSAYRDGTIFKVGGKACRDANEAVRLMESIARFDEWYEC